MARVLTILICAMASIAWVVAKSPRATAQTPSREIASIPDLSDSAHPELLSVLEKYSRSRDWILDVDDKGRPFKITGGKLAAVMLETPRSVSFLRDLENAMGFSSAGIYLRDTQNTARLSIVDFRQRIRLPSGEVLDVIDASLRLVGDSRGDAFLVYNALRPVSPTIRWASQLAPNDAVAIAKAYLQDTSYQLESQQAAVFAHQEPHQKVTRVLARNGPSTRLLLVGHDTREVVADRLISLK